MKQIILIRHAKVAVNEEKAIEAEELHLWVKEYDHAAIAQESQPSKELCEWVQNSDVVVSSTLRRAIDSAHRLGVTPYEHNALFNEAGLPNAYRFPLKLRPKTWLFILRGLLLMGFGKKDHSLQASKVQAQKASQYLMELSKTYNNVTLIGHGGMNWLIHKELLKNGWRLEGKPNHKNWGMTRLTKAF